MKDSKHSFRLVLNGTDVQSGTSYSNGMFHVMCNPTLPFNSNTRKYQFAVESFVCNNSSVTTILGYIPTLTQKDSFNTGIFSNNQCVFMTTSNSLNKTINQNTIGHQLSSIDVLRNGMLNVYFLDALQQSITMSAWSMSLIFWEIEEED